MMLSSSQCTACKADDASQSVLYGNKGKIKIIITWTVSRKSRIGSAAQNGHLKMTFEFDQRYWHAAHVGTSMSRSEIKVIGQRSRLEQENESSEIVAEKQT